jgi:PTS system mannose-specific IIA component
MTGILLITHGQIGAELLKAATITFNGSLPTLCLSLAVETQDTLEKSHQNALDSFARLKTHCQQILILTDLYGATPANIAHKIASEHPPTQVIAGVNLPMLFRILNYANQDLATLVQKALNGGKDGVIAPTASHTI